MEEDKMNKLITQLLGDSYISLACDSASCIHRDSLPHPILPPSHDAFATNTAFLFLAAFIFAAMLYYLKRRPTSDQAYYEQDTLAPSFDINFSKIGVTSTTQKTILHSVSGRAKSGKLMAVLGPSGSGKSTLLHILAGRSAHQYDGEVIINGRVVLGSVHSDSIGFVEQNDALLGSLTVFETLLFAAMVKLPIGMDTNDKHGRVYETLLELDILHIAHSRIGSNGLSGISGGERRRVSIGCELIRNPSVLILDEPTSGLDAFNAYNVVECLSILASQQNKTVIISIHQPRSNIVSLFDDILLLGQGRMLYSGDTSSCADYFGSAGYHCPPGYNMADFLSKHSQARRD